VTTIANTRSFDGVDDQITFADGTLMGNFTALTFAAIIKPHSDLNALRKVFSFHGSNPSIFFLHEFNGITPFLNFSQNYSNNSFAAAANGWMLLAITKADGNAIPRFHKYVYGTSTWTHTDSSNFSPDPATTDSSYDFIVGYAGGSNPLDCDVAWVGVWRGTALTDGQLEGMEDSTTNIEALSPTSSWLFNQTAVGTTVQDRIGTSHESSRTGTTVISTADLAFDVGAGGGGGSPSLGARMMMMGVG
jgi:hypothetical protein